MSGQDEFEFDLGNSTHLLGEIEGIAGDLGHEAELVRDVVKTAYEHNGESFGDPIKLADAVLAAAANLRSLVWYLAIKEDWPR
jgi:hypothetical protein